MVEHVVTVTDRLGQPYRVRVCLDESGGIHLLAHAGHDAARVGHVVGVRQEDGSLLLGDILIEAEVRPRPRNSWQKMLARLGQWRPQLVNYRRRGLGDALLKLFLAEANRAGVPCVRGSITEGDLDRWPGLTDWYRNHGFQVLPPQLWTLPGAVHGVERSPSVESPSGC